MSILTLFLWVSAIKKYCVRNVRIPLTWGYFSASLRLWLDLLVEHGPHQKGHARCEEGKNVMRGEVVNRKTYDSKSSQHLGDTVVGGKQEKMLTASSSKPQWQATHFCGFESSILHRHSGALDLKILQIVICAQSQNLPSMLHILNNCDWNKVERASLGFRWQVLGVLKSGV